MGNTVRHILGLPAPRPAPADEPRLTNEQIYLMLVCRRIQSRDTGIALRLLKRLHDIDCLSPESGLSPLHTAAETGDARCIEALLERSADVNVRDCRNFTPLHLVAGAPKADLRCSELLIQAGVSLDAQDVWGKTALHRAVIYNNTKLAVLLLKAGCSVNITDDLDRPVLTLFANSTTYSSFLFNVMLEQGANINLKDKRGRTAIYYAVLVGNIPLVKKLAELMSLTDMDDLICLATSKCHLECTKFFLTLGAGVPEGLVQSALLNLTRIPTISRVDGHFAGLLMLLRADGRCATRQMVLQSLTSIISLVNQMEDSVLDDFPSLVPLVCILMTVDSCALNTVWPILKVNTSVAERVLEGLSYVDIPTLAGISRTVIRRSVLAVKSNMYVAMPGLTMLPERLRQFLLLKEYR